MYVGVLQEIKNKNIHLNDENDKLIWTLISYGIFALDSAWNLVRHRGLHYMIGKYAWHPHVPIKISFFIWRIIRNVVPTDYAIQKKGVPIISKCVCCNNNPFIEYTTHLLLLSETASQVWNFFSDLMEIDARHVTIGSTLNNWWLQSRGYTVQAWLYRLLPCMIL